MAVGCQRQVEIVLQGIDGSALVERIREQRPSKGRTDLNIAERGDVKIRVPGLDQLLNE